MPGSNNIYAEKLHNLVLDSIDIGIIYQSREGKVLSCNKKALELLGLTIEQIKGEIDCPQGWGISPENNSGIRYTDFVSTHTFWEGLVNRKAIVCIEKSPGDTLWASAQSIIADLENEEICCISLNNVTAFYKQNLQLNETQRRLELIVSSLEDRVFEYDREGTHYGVWTSDEEKLIIPKELIINRKLSEIYPEAFANNILKGIKTTLDSQVPAVIEYCHPFQGVSDQWFRAKIYPLQGVPDRVSMVVSDITEEKRMLEQLKENEKRWELAIKASHQGLWDWNALSGEIYFAERWKEILGYAENELDNKFEAWDNRIHPDDREMAQKSFAEILSGKSVRVEFEHRLRHRNGAYVWVLNRGMVISRTPDGRPVRIVGTHTDITERKNFEEAIRLSENKFSSAFNYSGIGFALVSPKGYWLDVNEAICNILGYTKTELLKLTFQDITHPDDLEIDLKYVTQMLAKEIDTYQLEKRYIHKNGKIVWAMLKVSLVWNLDQSPRFFISQIVDISHSKELISQLEQKNNSLEMIASELEVKMSQLEDFNRIIAHNLRGPVGNIESLISLMDLDLPQEDKEQNIKYLKVVSENLTHTLNDLMEVMEIRLNKSIPFEECSVEELLQRVCDQLYVNIFDKKAVIKKELKTTHVRYPKVYLESILYNLISNALKYSKPETAPEIKVSCSVKYGKTVLTVEDNGLGIDLQKHGKNMFKLKKIFHKGFDSKGVGLFITKNQIETLGGKISVESTPGEGSKFTVVF